MFVSNNLYLDLVKYPAGAKFDDGISIHVYIIYLLIPPYDTI